MVAFPYQKKTKTLGILESVVEIGKTQNLTRRIPPQTARTKCPVYIYSRKFVMNLFIVVYTILACVAYVISI